MPGENFELVAVLVEVANRACSRCPRARRRSGACAARPRRRSRAAGAPALALARSRASLSWKCRPSNVVVSCVQRLRRIRQASSSMSIRTPIRGRNPVLLVLELEPGGAHPQLEPAAGDVVDRRGHLRDHGRMPVRHAQDEHPAANAVRVRRHRGQQRQALELGTRRVGVDRIEVVEVRYPVVAELLAAQPAVAIVLEARVLRPEWTPNRIASPKICTAGLRRLPGRGRAPSRRSCPAGPGGARC